MQGLFSSRNRTVSGSARKSLSRCALTRCRCAARKASSEVARLSSAGSSMCVACRPAQTLSMLTCSAMLSAQRSLRDSGWEPISASASCTVIP